MLVFTIMAMKKTFKEFYMTNFTFQDDILKKSRLCNRGPDKSKDVKIDIAEHLSAVITGHVLHLRGDEMAVQPAQDSQGNLLLWNGEIFGGINV
jgi:asparagine synthetase B (glutamine-hydrolysing)